MDVFLREIQFEVIKKWVTYDLAKRQIHYDTNQKEDSIEYIMESDNTYAKIVFHDECMIELALTNKKNGNVEFYLHFRLETMPHTLGLYREFMNTIDKIESQKTIRVLLSCTSGLTTSFFAETLIEAASSSHLDYEFSAVSYNELPEANAAGIYDIILLAPQISYQLSRVQSIFHRIPVVAIPSALFAKYDTRGTINLIEKSLKASSSAKQHTQLLNSASINYAHPALIIGVLSSRRHIRIVYRVYHHDDILYFGEVVKSELHVNDLDDIINMALYEQPGIKLVAIAMPGIISDGRRITHGHYHSYDVYEWFKFRHPNLHFSIDNDVNAIATGIYGVIDRQSLSFFFLPRGHTKGSTGSIFQGQLITGSHSFAGELFGLPLALSDEAEKLVNSEKGAIELVAKNIACIISILDPELIAYYCSNIASVEDLKAEIARYIPEAYIPPIKKVDSLQEYILYGEMILAVQKEAHQ